MKKRLVELTLVLLVAALATTFFWKTEPHAEVEAEAPLQVSSPTPLAASPIPTPENTPLEYYVATPAAREDFEAAEGMTGCFETLETPIPAPSLKRAKLGAALYQRNCSACHGKLGLGDGDASVALDPRPTNLTLPANYKYGHMELAIFRTTKYGVEATGMAPWEGILSDDDVWNITFYVRSMQKVSYFSDDDASD